LQGSGEDEIVVCAWDGMTYIVDQGRNVVRYQFEENVSAFCAGKSLFCIGASLLVNEYFPMVHKNGHYVQKCHGMHIENSNVQKK